MTTQHALGPPIFAGNLAKGTISCVGIRIGPDRAYPLHFTLPQLLLLLQQLLTKLMEDRIDGGRKNLGRLWLAYTELQGDFKDVGLLLCQ